MKSYDAIILGFGKGGKTLAHDLTLRNRRVALVERDPAMWGGTCINTGCIPTKALLHRAIEAHASGAGRTARRRLYREAVADTERFVAGLRERNRRTLVEAGVDLYTGVGSLRTGEVVEVRGADGTELLTSPDIFLDTGADPLLPPIPGVADNPRVHTSASMLRTERLPRRLVIIGGGPIGLEFATIYALFGSEVTVVEGADRFLGREDRDVADAVRRRMEGQGIRFILGARVEAVEPLADYERIRCTAGDRPLPLKADAVLVAVGRRPHTLDLNLEAAGIRTDERGAIRVDAWLRTSNPRIRALGDVKGGAQYTYVSLDDYRIIRDELFGDSQRSVADREPVPYTIYLDPPLSRVGLTEEEARARGLAFRTRRIDVASYPRARILGHPEGMMKALIEEGTERILGCTIFAAESGETINTVSLAIHAGLPAMALRDGVWTHPTMTETLNDLFA